MDISPFGKAVAIILTVVLIFLFPLPYVAKTVSETTEDLVNTYATEFSDTARQQGTITKDMYEKMIRELDKTGELYDVDLEVSHPVSGIETAEIELGDKMPEEDTVQVSYIKNGALVGEINGNELHEGHNHVEEIQSFSIHTHTNDCYTGHRHDSNCVIAGNMDTNKDIYASISNLTNGREYVVMSIKCCSCYQCFYQIYYYSNPEYGTFQCNSIYTGVNPDGTSYKTTQTFNLPYGEAKCEQIKNAIKPFVTKFLPYSNTNITSMPETIFPVIDSTGNVKTKPYVGCANCLAFTGPVFSGNVGYYSGDYYFGTRSVEKILNHYGSAHPCATIIFRESGGNNIYHWNNELIYFNQNYLKANGSIGSKTGKSVYRFLTMPGTGPNPGPEWTKVYTTVNFGGGDEIINEYRKPNPEWNTAYNRFIYADFTWFGYDPKYSCPWCLANGSLPKSFNKVLSCGQEQDETPECNQVVTSITATNVNQTVIQGAAIISTASATYLDGHTGIVNCSVSGFDTNQIGNQTVSLIYTGLVGNAKTTGISACTVNVIVKAAYKLTGITVSPESQEVPRYQTPNFVVTAFYDNGTSKQVIGYTISDYNSSFLETQPITITYKENDITKTAMINVTIKNLTITCPVCKTVYYMDDNDTDQGCPNCNSTITAISASPDNIVLHQGEPLDIAVEAVYINGKRSLITDWTSNYDPTQVGIWDVTITYETFTTVISVDVRHKLMNCNRCLLEYEINNDGTDPGCPVCSKTVVSLEVTPELLTINKHQSLPITVTATYKDGHTDIVNDWASNLLTDTAGIYEVMILYQNAIGLIKVTVLEDGQIECPICGLKYLFNDSPKGCPSCYVTLTGMEASLRNGGTKVPYRSKLNLQITKIFKDEHRELTYTGWTVSDYNPNQLGNQTIKVNYGGFQGQLDIEVVDVLPEVTCQNGHTYYLNEDGSNSGCPYCNSPEGRVEALFYFDTTYTYFILDEIYTHGEYRLEKGDYLKVTIKPRKVSILSKLLSLFNGQNKKEYTFGGEVS